MLSRIFVFCAVLFSQWTNMSANEIIWEGEVNADGVPTKPIHLVIHKRYQITATKSINLGKWIQEGEKLANDACYLFNPEGKAMDRSESLKNNQDISVWDGKYHADHIYQSQPFEATQNRLFFWINDSDYDDNSGSLHVTVTRLE